VIFEEVLAFQVRLPSIIQKWSWKLKCVHCPCFHGNDAYNFMDFFEHLCVSFASIFFLAHSLIGHRRTFETLASWAPFSLRPFLVQKIDTFVFFQSVTTLMYFD